MKSPRTKAAASRGDSAETDSDDSLLPFGLARRIASTPRRRVAGDSAARTSRAADRVQADHRLVAHHSSPMHRAPRHLNRIAGAQDDLVAFEHDLKRPREHRVDLVDAVRVVGKLGAGGIGVSRYDVAARFETAPQCGLADRSVAVRVPAVDFASIDWKSPFDCRR